MRLPENTSTKIAHTLCLRTTYETKRNRFKELNLTWDEASERKRHNFMEKLVSDKTKV